MVVFLYPALTGSKGYYNFVQIYATGKRKHLDQDDASSCYSHVLPSVYMIDLSLAKILSFDIQ